MHSYNETLTLLLDFSCEIIVLIFFLKVDRLLLLLNTGVRKGGNRGEWQKTGEKKIRHVKMVCQVTCLLLCEGLTKPHLKCAK